jgi:hypothetical protein
MAITEAEADGDADMALTALEILSVAAGLSAGIVMIFWPRPPR